MKRRRLLGVLASAALPTFSGCLDTGEGSAEDVVLPPQEDQVADSEDLGYPAYGQRFPGFTMDAPLRGRKLEVPVDGSVDVVTAVYTSCPAECLVVGSQLAAVQHETIDRGLEDDVSFVAVSFDPENDTGEALQGYGESIGVDLDAGNWYFLLPGSMEEAEEVVERDLGLEFERRGGEFLHSVVTFLVNPEGYVERAYRGERPEIDRVADDVEAVVEAHLEGG